MSDPQDMAEDLDDDVSAFEAVTADERVEHGGDVIDDDLSEALIEDHHGLIGDVDAPTPEESALHLVEDS